ncbi:MAG: hypothetical protein M3R08_08680, partial [Bacteroidota bacterium]|nr:hypothetical protein [Bacteroidota bacterium]
PEPIITTGNIHGTKMQWILDLGMPGNVQPQVGEIPGVTVLNVDEISKITDHTLRQRIAQVPLALEFIEEAVDEILEWSRMRERLGILADVKRKLESIHAQRSVTGMADIDQEADARIKRILKSMAVGMRKGDGRGCQYLMAINEYVAATAVHSIATSPIVINVDQMNGTEITA